jgi:hypothetical protein
MDKMKTSLLVKRLWFVVPSSLRDVPLLQLSRKPTSRRRAVISPHDSLPYRVWKGCREVVYVYAAIKQLLNTWLCSKWLSGSRICFFIIVGEEAIHRRSIRTRSSRKSRSWSPAGCSSAWVACWLCVSCRIRSLRRVVLFLADDRYWVCSMSRKHFHLFARAASQLRTMHPFRTEVSAWRIVIAYIWRQGRTW